MHPLLKRELEVAFSKDAQPVWFRIVKYIALGFMFYFLWGSLWLWIILVSMLLVGGFVHFWYRHKTEGWTKSYGMWKHERDRGKLRIKN